MNQPKHLLPLAKEAKRITEEIRIEKINEQWAGILQEQLLNQSFNDQLNSIQILEQLAPLQLAKEHLPGDIVDILERLGKADNIPFNQLYYIAENCADHYYSKVIENFVALLKCQFIDRQLLLVNTARSLKFLEEYMDRQALIWKMFQKHKNIPDNIQDLHFHIDNFKTNIEKEFSLLKEATCKNVENFQSSLNLQQTYSMALCSHINNIYNKLAEIQQQLPHSAQHMNTSDLIQIEAPDFDPDIDEALPIPADQNTDYNEIQGSVNSTQQFSEKTAMTRTPASSHQDTPIEIFIGNGTTPSILPLCTYSKFPILHTYPKTESNTPIHTGGGLITSHFWLEIPLKLQHQTIQIKALMCDSECPYDLILGRTSMAQLSAWQDYAAHKLYLQQILIPLTVRNNIQILPGKTGVLALTPDRTRHHLLLDMLS